jgi:hypothetical protein
MSFKFKCAIVSINKHKLNRCRARIRSSVRDVTIVNDIGPFPPHPNGHDEGCYSSHIMLWQKLMRRFPLEEHFVVFEDDATFCKEFSVTDTLQQVRVVAAKSSSIDVCYLGWRIPPFQNCSVKKLSKNVLQARVNDLHAYVISTSYMRRLLSSEKHYRGVPIDVVVRDDPECYALAIYPMLSIQSGENGKIQLQTQKFVLWAPMFNNLRSRVLIFSGIIAILLSVVLISYTLLKIQT